MASIPKVNLIEVLDGAERETTKVQSNPSHWRRERYLPLRHGELERHLSSDGRLPSDERPKFLQLCRLLSAHLHYEYHERIEKLKGEYDPFDPDAGHDRRPSPVERDRCIEQLFEKLAELLRRANYHKLSQTQIEQAVSAASDWGVRLKVDFSKFERLDVYARGDVLGRRTRHHWRNFYRAEEVDVPIYLRLVIVFQLRPTKRPDKNLDPNAIYIKLFKNIPKEDVDMMLPGVKAQFSLFDRGKILLPTLPGIAMALYKLVLTILVSAVLGLAGIILLVGGLLTYVSRSVFGYMNTQNKYQLNLTRSLYFQNLDNSAGVLLRLTDEAEHQDFCEMLLAYFLLWRNAGTEGASADELDRDAEKLLSDICGHALDFDVTDSLEKLQRLGLVVPTADGRWNAATLQDALATLTCAWNTIFEPQAAGEM